MDSRRALRSRKFVATGATGAAIRAAAEARTICSRSGIISSRPGPGRRFSSAARSASPMPSRATRSAAAMAGAASSPAAVSMRGSIASEPAGRPISGSR